MSVVKMSKFSLTGLASEKDALLDALHRTQRVELSDWEEENAPSSELQSRVSRVRKGIAFVSDRIAESKKQEYFPENTEGLKDDILLSYDDFMQISGREAELTAAMEKAETLEKELSALRAERVKAKNLIEQLSAYREVNERFSDFSDTKCTRCFFGLIDEAAIPKLEENLAESPAALTIYSRGKPSAVCVVAHNDCAEEIAALLNGLSFSKCTFSFPETAAEKIEELAAQTKSFDAREEALKSAACALAPYLKDWKIFSDYLSLQLEKAEAYDSFFKTASTFTLHGYVPREECDFVRAAIDAVTPAAVTEFTEPTEEDTPPTLLKNRGPAKSAEFVTNMYSAPDYREYDPNGVVFWFFMIFFGLIMADIGYGILLFAGGLLLSARLKIDNGFKKLTKILMYGGLFTIVFGALFGSLFGFSLYTFLPDPSSGNRTDVLTILLGCLALGLFQITVGYALKAVNDLRDGRVLDALCDAFTWILFNVGLFFAVFNFLTEYFEIPVANNVHAFFETMTLPGIVMLGVGLLGAMLTAGRKEKILGKFTKGFGALYGVINLLSDVLSYARLFGLMLSGMIIAQQFNGIGLDLIAGGAVGYVFGPLVMLVGHAFNIAMGVLGAYIHDCRLQYIEFFSKFYTGEGKLFTPIGSRVQYIHIQQ